MGNSDFPDPALVAVITILSKCSDVRNAETDMLNFLYSQIEARSFKFKQAGANVQSTLIM